MLPSVKIRFANGAIGGVEPSADSVTGILGVGASAVADTFALNTAYQIYRFAALEVMGVTAENNAALYKAVKQFYAEAGDGAELWIYGVAMAADKTLGDVLDTDAETDTAAGKAFIAKANGRLRCLAVAAEEALYWGEDEDENAVSLLQGIVTKAQGLAVWATNELYAPLSVLLGVTSIHALNLKELTANRVSVVVGSDTDEEGGLSAVGVLAGRFAACAVQENVGKVRMGALAIDKVYVGLNAMTNDIATSLNESGYITFRTFVAKGGYYLSDDHTACAESDDYHSLARRRTIDKAYRIAYAVMVEHLNEEVPVTSSGTIVAPYARSWESEVISAIYNQMTVNNNLSTDDDKGVECKVDTENNVTATGTVNVSLRVRPYGYAKYIEVELGFGVES